MTGHFEKIDNNAEGNPSLSRLAFFSYRDLRCIVKLMPFETPISRLIV